MKNVTYILKCSDNSLYTGWTNDIKHRLKMHNEGKGAKYTRGRGPVELVYLEEFDTKQEAMSKEAKIKRLTRKEKLPTGAKIKSGTLGSYGINFHPLQTDERSHADQNSSSDFRTKESLVHRSHHQLYK